MSCIIFAGLYRSQLKIYLNVSNAIYDYSFPIPRKAYFNFSIFHPKYQSPFVSIFHDLFSISIHIKLCACAEDSFDNDFSAESISIMKSDINFSFIICRKLKHVNFILNSSHCWPLLNNEWLVKLPNILVKIFKCETKSF